ncbi:hypothetical protein LN042_34330 [Kitasatospora sp. RB6PN24]|uniref:hypothetical protein n=1 Tax=Kitasatospora humi TaxID=2893891 RepID=UPI001E2BDEE0|nr:hypothetical protein [Kitasatospora humi]MCC9312079.1 hypothetical protein [Kitasatospora humi]
MPTDRDSVYNDPNQIFDISSVPSWKTPPLHGAHAPGFKLSSRAKAGIAAGGVVLAATGMIAWSNYSAAQANADVRKAQIALDAQRLDLQRQQQAAEAAKTQAQETDAQKARREAVQACVAKAGNTYNAISDCGKAFPVVDAPGMTNTSQTVSAGKNDSGSSEVGLIVLGALGAACTVGWAKKKFGRHLPNM